MQKYSCDVIPSDVMTVYVSDEERTEPMLAMVMENKLNQKISVCLTRDQAIALGNQVQDFLINGVK